jgi:DNA-binding GntR family transcriptional regulator
MIRQSIVYGLSAGLAARPGPQGSMTAPANLAIDTSPSLHELVYRRLRQAIVDGTLRPGARLVESELGVRMGVSRSPVREALRRLEQENLVVLTPRRGVRVAEAVSELSQFQEMFDVRAALEALAARLAVRRATAAQVSRIGAAIRRMERAVEAGDLHGIIHADADFHRQLVLSAGNPTLERMLSSLLDQIQRMRLVIHARPENSRLALAEHRAVLAAIVRRDESAAVAHIEGHVEAARRRLGEGLAGGGEAMPARAPGRHRSGRTRPPPARAGGERRQPSH